MIIAHFRLLIAKNEKDSHFNRTDKDELSSKTMSNLFEFFVYYLFKDLLMRNSDPGTIEKEALLTLLEQSESNEETWGELFTLTEKLAISSKLKTNGNRFRLHAKTHR